MNSSTMNNKQLLKRRSSSVNYREQKQKQKRSYILPSTNTSSPLILSPRQNGALRSKTPEIRSKISTPGRSVSETLPNIYKPNPPPVVPRKLKVEPPVPKERKLIGTDAEKKESDIVEEQIITLKLVNESEKFSLPNLKDTHQVLVDPKMTQSTPYTPGLCGLINIGNTCFMSSALQCLSNIPELTQWAKNQNHHLSTQKTDIIYVYTTLIQSMWSGENKNVNPRHLKDIISHSAPIFADYGQKDSHEFLNTVLNALERATFSSIIPNLFHIPTQSQVTCTGCNYIDMTDEITTFLPLPLPKKTLHTKEISLENLINDYCFEENLDGLYYCHTCQQYTQAKQKTNISLPLSRVLIIQLKRFPFDGTDQKIDTFVRYKLQHKNLISNNDIYQLCAVSSHRGNLASGHYTTLAKNHILQQWYEFNDSQIHEIKSDSVITSNAYVLVYLKSEEWDSSTS